MKNTAGRLIIICMAIFSGMIQSRGQEKTFTLDAAIDYALTESADVTLNSLEIEAANAQIRQYWASGIPSVNGSVGYMHNILLPVQFIPAQAFDPMAAEDEYAELEFGLKNQLSASAELQALLFSGSFFKGLKAQRLYKELAKSNMGQVERDIKLAVSKAYYNVLLNEENLSSMQSNLEINKQLLREARIAYENGMAEKLDVQRLALEIDNLESSIRSSRTLNTLSRNLLKFQMNYPESDTIILDEDLESSIHNLQVANYDLEEDLQINNRPEYLPLTLQEELYRINRQVIKWELAPSLTGFVNFNTSVSRNHLFNDNNPGWVNSSVAGLNLQVPIFNGLGNLGKQQQAQVEIEKTVIQREEFERGVALEVENVKIALDNAKREYEKSKNSLALAEEILEVTGIKFKEGVASSTELIQAQGSVTQTRNRYFTALYDLMISYIDLKKALGTL